MRIKVTFPPHGPDTLGAGGGFRGGSFFTADYTDETN